MIYGAGWRPDRQRGLQAKKKPGTLAGLLSFRGQSARQLIKHESPFLRVQHVHVLLLDTG